MAIASAIRAGVQIDTGLWLIVLTTANSDKQNLSHENKKDSEVRGVNHIRVHSEAAKLPKHWLDCSGTNKVSQKTEFEMDA